MTLCLSYRMSSLTLLVGSICLLPGCIDPKSLGQETDDSGSESSEEGTSGPTAEGSQSNTGNPGTYTDGPGTGTDTDGPGTDTGPGCPPIDIAECVECECIDNEWSCSNTGCIYDCTDQACGTSCMMCPEDDPECTSPDAVGSCTADGQCVGAPPPKLGFCEGELQPGFENDLDVQQGCSDLVVFAHDAADERAIFIWIDQGLAQDVIDTGVPAHVEVAATDPSVLLDARSGTNVTMNECDDVLKPGVDIHETWRPTSGTLIIDVVPGEFLYADATVELVDVVLARETYPGPAPITVNLTLSDINVGWFPG